MELIDLYKLLLVEYVKGKNLFICNAINDLEINFYEESLLREHFLTQRPSETQYINFYRLPYCTKDNSQSWFSCKYSKTNDRVFNLRIKLLETIIKNLENTCV